MFDEELSDIAAIPSYVNDEELAYKWYKRANDVRMYATDAGRTYDEFRECLHAMGSLAHVRLAVLARQLKYDADKLKELALYIPWEDDDNE